MKPQNEQQKLTERANKAAKPRFKIEKLEERIAPRHRRGHYPGYQGHHGCHYNPHGKLVGNC